MTVCDNTIKGQGLGKLVKKLRKRSTKAGEIVATTVLKILEVLQK